MAYSAATIIATVEGFLNDAGNDVWSEATICKHASEAQHLITMLRPDATATTTTHTLTTTPKQTLVAGSVRLLDVIMNTDGAPIRKTTREILNETIPDWTTDTGTSVEFFAHDPENPLEFWVYPKPATAFTIDLIRSKLPDEFTTASTSLGISDIYITPLYEWTLYRCFSMETKGMDMGEASIHLNNFFNVMGIKAQNEIMLQRIQEAT